MHDVAAAYFAEQLASPAGARFRDYLQRERGLTPATVAALKLGWAPPSRDGLRQRLSAQGFAEGLIRQSGLVSVRDDGTVVDRFRNRLMVPICRDTGSIVAFGGRALEPDQVPKYLNSPETPIYTKSRTLYGLNLTKSDLRKAGFAIVVEGYFDFAQLYQAGGLPVVATCGTALTTQQAQMLRRFTPKVIINFDPDTAGQNAAERSCELLVGRGLQRERRAPAGRRGSRRRSCSSTAARPTWPSCSARSRTWSSCSSGPRLHTISPATTAGVSSCSRCWRWRRASPTRPRATSSPTAWRTRPGSPKRWSAPRSARPPPPAGRRCRSGSPRRRPT